MTPTLIEYLAAVGGLTAFVGAWTLAMFAVMFTEKVLKRRATK